MAALVVNEILSRALRARASDVHIHSGEAMRVRVDGEIRVFDEYPQPVSVEQAWDLVRQTLPAEKIEDLKRELDVDASYAPPELGGERFRINVGYTRDGGVAAWYRSIPQEIRPLTELAAPLALARFAEEESGLVLVTGPTGSGKSTTLAAIVALINKTRQCHILTIEDPIEYVHRSDKAVVTQREVGANVTSFARGLRAGLRQDPDVVLVGELRDLETAQMALSTAETGHLVFATLHTSSASQTVDRMIDIFPPEQHSQVRAMLADVIKGIVAQKLIKRSDGIGRIAVHEVLVATTSTSAKIREGKSAQLPSDLTMWADLGNQPIEVPLVHFHRAGMIDLETALAKANDQERLQGYLKLIGERKPIQEPRFVTDADLRSIGTPTTLHRTPSAAPSASAPRAPLTLRPTAPAQPPGAFGDDA